MKYLYILLIILLFIVLLTIRVSICLTQRENTDILLKIGPFLRFKVHNSNIDNICQSLTKYDFSVFINTNNSIDLDKIFKEISIDKISIINSNNIFNTLWNIYIPFSYNILNLYLEQYLISKFKKVSNKYYSIIYTTTGTYKLNFEVVLSIRVYQIFKLLLIYLKNKKKVKYDQSN